MDWVIELDIVVLSQDGATAAAQDFATQTKTHLEVGLSERAQQLRPAADKPGLEPDQPRSQRESDPRVSYVYRVTAAAAPLSADEWRSITQAANLRVVDRALSKHVRPEKSGRYTLFVLQGADVLAAGRVREWVVGAHRHAWFTTATFPDPRGVAQSIQKAVETYLVTPVETEEQQTATHQFHQVSLPPAPEYRLSFSLLNANSAHAFYTWAFDKAAEAYLLPFLHDVSLLGNFSIDSQVLHYVALPKQPLYDEQAKAYYFTPAMLSYFVHPNDLNSDFTVTSEVTLNFMVYIPSPDQSPLYIRYDDGTYSDTNAFLILRTGGIVIFNPEEKNTTSPLRTLEPSELYGPMSVFVEQLRELLGVPAALFPTIDTKKGTSAPEVKEGCEDLDVQFLPSPSGVSKWELDVLLRQRTYENLVKAKTSILTLCQLVKKQTHMVVHDHIKDKLLSALHKLQLALNHLEGGRDGPGFDYATAHRHALEGLKEAESAFFDKEMVSLLYYPPEHEAAIYIPHFLPVFYPIVVGLLFELKTAIFKRVRKWWRRRQAAQAPSPATPATTPAVADEQTSSEK
jgi:phosphatidylinositol glycan class S